MFLPVAIRLRSGGGSTLIYDRMLETSAKFDRLATEAADMREPLTTIGQLLHAQMAAAFATEGATGYSGRWAPLSPDYGAWKAKHGGAPLLVGLKRTGAEGRRPQSYTASGMMRRQLLVPLADRSTWHVYPKRLLYAPLSNIAGFHQSGTPRMPARPPVDLSVTFLRSVDRTFVAWIAELAKKAGL